MHGTDVTYPVSAVVLQRLADAFHILLEIREEFL